MKKSINFLKRPSLSHFLYLSLWLALISPSLAFAGPYAHIKSFNAYVPYCQWWNPASTSDYSPTCYDEMVFVANHFDISASFTHIKQLLKTTNPNLQLFTYRNISALTANEVNTNWPNFAQQNGYNIENGFLHYKEDTQARGRYVMCVPGYDPANSAPDGLSCSDTTSDHYSRAGSLIASRVPDWWDATWRASNLTDPGMIAYNKYATELTFPAGGYVSDYLYLDIAGFNALNSSIDVSKTYEYWGLPMDSNHPRTQEMWALEDTLRDNLSQIFNKPISTIMNAITPSSFYHFPFIADGFKARHGIIQFEVWTGFTDNNNAPAGGMGRAYYYSLDYQNSKTILQDSLQGQKFVLGSINYGANPDLSRPKMYLYSFFLLLNNPNLMFSFYNPMTETNGPGHPGTNTVPIWDHGWVKAIEFPIGQPTQNTLGLPDVFGNENTTEHVLLQEGNDPSTPSNINASCTGVKQFHLLGRFYTNALVMTKIMDYCGRVDSRSLTTHTLPQHPVTGSNLYRELNTDGTLGDEIINEVSLMNNEGAILIPVPSVPSDGNHAPVIQPIVAPQVNEGQPVEVMISAIDEDQDALSFASTVLPSGATLIRYNEADINKDGKVSLSDAVLFTAHVGSHKGDSNYDANSDFNSDGAVDTEDYNVLHLMLNYSQLNTSPYFNKALLKWPSATPQGTYDITVSVSDGHLSDAKTMTLMVNSNILGAPETGAPIGGSETSIAPTVQITDISPVDNPIDLKLTEENVQGQTILQSSFALDVIVYDNRGRSIDGALVNIKNTTSGQVMFQGLTGNEGKVHLTLAGDTGYTIEITKSGFKTSTANITLENEMTVEIKLDRLVRSTLMMGKDGKSKIRKFFLRK